MKEAKRELAFLLGFMVIAFTIPIAVFLANQSDSLKYFSKASLDNQAQLYLWPASLPLSKCDNISSETCPKNKIEIILDTKEKTVSGVDLFIRYDPKMLNIIKQAIIPGMADYDFNQTLRPFNYYRDGMVDSENGLITIKATGSFKGEKGVVATFFVNGIQTGKTSLEIISGGEKVTQVWDESGKNNVVGAVSGAEIVIN